MNKTKLMELTIDHIAYELMSWCNSDTNSFKDLWSNNGDWEKEAISNLTQSFNKKELVVKEDEQVYSTTSDKIDLLFNASSNIPSKKILAGLSCESLENSDNYKKQIICELKKLKESSLKEEFSTANVFLISLYFDLRKREFLHENNFIEIFNNLEIGCAIRKIK